MKRYISIICIAALALGGCGWPVHAREVVRLQLIQTLGCDASDGGVTVSASSGPQPGGGDPVRLAARGESVTDAIRKLQNWSAREELFFSHVRYAVLGEAAAQRGAGPLLDYFERSTQTALDLPLLVVRGGEARELVTGSKDPDYEVTALLSSVQQDAERMGTVHCFSVLDTARRLSRSGAALCCAVEAFDPGGNVPSAEDGARPVSAVGYAVLKDGKLAGYLTLDEALGADLLLGIGGAACLVLPAPGGSVTVELRRSDAELKLRREPGGSPVLDAALRVRAGIVQTDGADPDAPGVRETLDTALAEELARRCDSALAACRDLDADFLELGLLAERQLGGPAQETLPTNLAWNVAVEALVERSYDLSGSVPVKREAAEP